MIEVDKKKPTMRDVAKLAGVSVATVSYVLNNKASQNISEETRTKIFQIINLLDYSPLYYVKQLTNNSSSNIIIRCQETNDSIIKKAEFLHFMQQASSALKECGYNLVYLPDQSESTFSHIDAVICYDMSVENFRKISSNNFVPVIAVNSLIDDDSLFYQILPNYQIVRQAADDYFKGDYMFVMQKPNNLAVQQIVKETFSNIMFVSTLKDLLTITKNSLLKNKNILVAEQCTYECLQSECFSGFNLLYYSLHQANVITATIASIKNATARTKNLVHKILV